MGLTPRLVQCKTQQKQKQSQTKGEEKEEEEDQEEEEEEEEEDQEENRSRTGFGPLRSWSAMLAESCLDFVHFRHNVDQF